MEKREQAYLAQISNHCKEHRESWETEKTTCQAAIDKNNSCREKYFGKLAKQ